jgi:hypothetical protein
MQGWTNYHPHLSYTQLICLVDYMIIKDPWPTLPEVALSHGKGPHYEFMKLITWANVSCLDRDMHKSEENIVVTHESKVNIAYCYLFLATNESMTC